MKVESFVFNNVNYFHPYTRREFCDEILTEEGDFLFRKGRLQNEYVLSVRSQTEIKHIKPNTTPGGVSEVFSLIVSYLFTHS